MAGFPYAFSRIRPDGLFAHGFSFTLWGTVGW